MAGSPSRVDAKTVWAWALYDFANSSFTTLIVTFVYATFFTSQMTGDVISGTALWGRGATVTAVLVAVLSPLLGAYADRTGTRKRFLLATTVLAVIGAVALYFPVPGQALTALTIFVVANTAFELSAVFYNAFLPEISTEDTIGRISGWGWGLGYVGGLLALVAALFVLVLPEVAPFGLDAATFENVRASNVLVAVWFAVFSVPAFLVLREPPATAPGKARDVMRATIGELGETFSEIRRFRQVFRFLVARLVYNDGLNTIFAFGAVYAAGTFGFTTQEIIFFGIGLNLAAGLGAVAFGFLDDKVGGKPTILISLGLLMLATTAAVLAPDRLWIWVAGIAVGLAAGPNQAASRSLLGRFAPPDKETEFFGFFAFTGKVAAFAGPLLLGTFTELFDSQRAGVATILVFFVVGGVLLMRVDEAEGREASGRGASPDVPVPVDL